MEFAVRRIALRASLSPLYSVYCILYSAFYRPGSCPASRAAFVTTSPPVRSGDAACFCRARGFRHHTRGWGSVSSGRGCTAFPGSGRGYPAGVPSQHYYTVIIEIVRSCLRLHFQNTGNSTAIFKSGKPLLLRGNHNSGLNTFGNECPDRFLELLVGQLVERLRELLGVDAELAAPAD